MPTIWRYYFLFLNYHSSNSNAVFYFYRSYRNMVINTSMDISDVNRIETVFIHYKRTSRYNHNASLCHNFILGV